VEEWTRADTGVGAAIAAGSQLENGIWALLVIAARVRHRVAGALNEKRWVLIFVQWPWFRKRAIAMRMQASPTRFIRAVIIPAPRAVGVWKYATRRKEVIPRPSQPRRIKIRLGIKIRKNIDRMNRSTRAVNRGINGSEDM